MWRWHHTWILWRSPSVQRNSVMPWGLHTNSCRAEKTRKALWNCRDLYKHFGILNSTCTMQFWLPAWLWKMRLLWSEQGRSQEPRFDLLPFEEVWIEPDNGKPINDPKMNLEFVLTISSKVHHKQAGLGFLARFASTFSSSSSWWKKIHAIKKISWRFNIPA